MLFLCSLVLAFARSFSLFLYKIRVFGIIQLAKIPSQKNKRHAHMHARLHATTHSLTKKKHHTQHHITSSSTWSHATNGTATVLGLILYLWLFYCCCYIIIITTIIIYLFFYCSFQITKSLTTIYPCFLIVLQLQLQLFVRHR